MPPVPSASIYGVGYYLPEPVRPNSWWPENIVSQWTTRREAALTKPQPDAGELPDGAHLVLREMAALAKDVFNGARERRVMPDGMVSSEMETAAAKHALEVSGVNARDIGLVMTSPQLPDYLNVPTAPVVHRNLGLASECMSTGIESGCNGFQVQLNFAEKLISAGQIRYALLVSSCGAQHVLRPEDPQSAWFGEGATAVVLGPSEKHGILSVSHRTDGDYYRAVVLGRPNSRWYCSGEAPFLYADEPGAGRRMFLNLPHHGKEVLDSALAAAGATPDDVDFFAAHQGTSWLRKVTQEHVGMNRAKFVDTFAWTGSLASGNIPFVMALGQQEGLLREGDLVATYAGGTGLSYGAIVLRWGR